MSNLPARTKNYIGPVTDSRIWEGFQLRPDDVILSTPPKCGTTWSQAILMMLIHGHAEKDRMVWKDSIWLDCGFRHQAEAKEAIDAQTHRRCIKSHTPFDGILFDPKVTYLTVYRHPIDVYFSMLKHVANLKADILDFMTPPEPGAAFERFLVAPATDTGTDDLTLSSFLHHYRSFNRWSHLPNVHFFHYANLSANLAQQIRRYGACIGLSPSDRLVDDIMNQASFSSMKETTRTQDDGSGGFAVQHKFFDSGTSNKWEGRLSAAELSAYHERFAELAEPDEIAWLENGSAGLPD